MYEPYKIEVRPYVHGLEMIHVTIPGLDLPLIHCVRTEDVDKIKLLIEHANLGRVFSSDPKTSPEVMTPEQYFRDVVGWNEQEATALMNLMKSNVGPETPPEIDSRHGIPMTLPTLPPCRGETVEKTTLGVETPGLFFDGIMPKITLAPSPRPKQRPDGSWQAPPVIWDEGPGGEHVVFKPLFPTTAQTKTDYAEKVKEAKERIDARKKSGQCGVTGHGPGEPSSTCVLPTGHVGPHSWESMQTHVLPDPTAGLCMEKGGEPFVDKDGKSHQATCTLPAGHPGPHDWEGGTGK